MLIFIIDISTLKANIGMFAENQLEHYKIFTWKPFISILKI